MRTFQEMLEERTTSKEIVLFFDIETLQYNEENGRKKPSEYKNVTYSVAISWMNGKEVELERFPNFKASMDIIINMFKSIKKKPVIHFIAHNTNKYDNHFFRKDLLYYYPHMRVENFFLNTSNEKGNKDALRIKDLSKKDKDGIILEKRIKSSINLELTYYLYQQKFYISDNWVKTNSSIKMLGKKLLRLGVVTESELKTDFDYTKYNKDEDMTEEESRAYALQVFNQLDQDEKTYIDNDVILLAKSVYYYSDLFKGFDYSKMTFTSNILESYNTNNLTSFQLLNRIGEGKNKHELRYTDYEFAGQNFYDYLKPFYRGGLNFYNQFHVGKIIKTGVFGIDINSSYPYAMHNFKIPTYLKDYESHDEPTQVTIDYSDDYFTLFQLSKETFDKVILSKIDSIILKQILVKYYTTNDFININTYTFKMIENVTGIHFDTIPAYSRVTFECEHFGSREQIEEFYFVKTQGKQKVKVDYKSPYDITLTDEPNDIIFSQEEIDNSKVNLNGLYGIPALRPYFNLFRQKDNQLINIENGHKNAERNIVFSIFVTAVSVWNLLDPLQYLTMQEIDENFIYCDTDSLYIKVAVRHKLPDTLFHDFHLGKWGMDYENLPYFYVMNHKKYAYYGWDKKEKRDRIFVRSGGISHDSFDTNMSFEDFIRTQFSHGCEVQNNKSIYNADRTISIYPSTTVLEVGKGYMINTNDSLVTKIRKQIIEEVKENLDEFTSDVLYIETPFGTFSQAELFPYSNQVKNKHPLVYLTIKERRIRNIIESEQ